MKTYMPQCFCLDYRGWRSGLGWRALFGAGLLMWAVSRALASDTTGAEGASTNRPPCCRQVPAATTPSDKSLYLLDSEWTSDVGRRVKLSVFRGRPQVVALFFSRCEFACPIIVHDMKRIEQALPESIRGQVDFLLVSIDTERDTPKELAAYRKRQALPVRNWSLLTGGADDVRELAAMLGVSYRKDARGQFAHSNVITVLNAEGEIIHRQAGLNVDPIATIGVLNQCVRGPASK